MIFDYLTKMVYYEPIKVIINAPGLVEVIINMVVHYYGIAKSIIIDWDLLFTLKFWFLSYSFLGIKQRLSTVFYPQTKSQIERENSIIKAYFRAFVSEKQNNWAKLLPIAKFTYNNAKNTSIVHTSTVNIISKSCLKMRSTST